MTDAEIREYLTGKNDGELFATADRVRREVFNTDVYLRGIIEFSNHCKQDCLYCGLRRNNRSIVRYRLCMDEILECAGDIARSGISTIVLQTGEDPFYSDAAIADIISAIKSRIDIAITLSLGEREKGSYKLWRDAGADRYLIRLESFNEKSYSQARPGTNRQERLNCLETLRDLDYEVGSGIMIGLPGDSIDDVITAIRKLTVMHLHMIGMGPFVAHNQTPFAGESNGNVDMVLRAYALMRILNPMANIPSTSAMESARPGGRMRGLQVGANVIMPSFTPKRVKELYNIYPGKNVQQDIDEDGLQSVLTMIEKAGYNVSWARGDSPLKANEKCKM
ncbi:[FeFe] hydrogenase H-cluster radical SAM maturase HydE [bacterium]|nr:[FeFe] hydrogenase H-cluster radical SAM maturase HydE [bacterium]MBU1873963.1 [FeFe] hydrogenase H-cluster radical SAM maturase HydE [bacterium]